MTLSDGKHWRFKESERLSISTAFAILEYNMTMQDFQAEYQKRMMKKNDNNAARRRNM